MQHTQMQLNQIWDDVASGRQAHKADAVRSLAAPGGVDVLPVIVVNDVVAQVLSVPVKDNTARVVYARKPGGTWVELP